MSEVVKTTKEDAQYIDYILSGHIDEIEMTPDYPMLIDKPIWVFVYGTLMESFYNHSLLKKSRVKKVGRAVTRSADFHMYIQSGATYPYVAKSTRAIKGQGPTHLAGELYQVDLATLQDLDRLEGNTRHYIRRRESVVWNFDDLKINNLNHPQSVKPKFVEAFIYQQCGGLPEERFFEGDPQHPSYRLCDKGAQSRFGMNSAYSFSKKDTFRSD